MPTPLIIRRGDLILSNDRSEVIGKFAEHSAYESGEMVSFAVMPMPSFTADWRDKLAEPCRKAADVLEFHLIQSAYPAVGIWVAAAGITAEDLAKLPRLFMKP